MQEAHRPYRRHLRCMATIVAFFSRNNRLGKSAVEFRRIEEPCLPQETILAWVHLKLKLYIIRFIWVPVRVTTLTTNENSANAESRCLSRSCY